MRCNRFNEELQSYVAEELSTCRHLEIRAHLRRCLDCQRTVEALSFVSKYLSASKTPTPRLATGPQLLKWAKEKPDNCWKKSI